MASIIVRGLEDGLKARLRLRAARHGHSMEEEARAILKASLAQDLNGEPNLAAAIRRHIAPLGGVEIVVKPRERVRRPPVFGK